MSLRAFFFMFPSAGKKKSNEKEKKHFLKKGVEIEDIYSTALCFEIITYGPIKFHVIPFFLDSTFSFLLYIFSHMKIYFGKLYHSLKNYINLQWIL